MSELCWGLVEGIREQTGKSPCSCVELTACGEDSQGEGREGDEEEASVGGGRRQEAVLAGDK